MKVQRLGDKSCMQAGNRSATDTQVGGDHYKNLPIQPITYIMGNDLGYCEGAVVKYISRWRDKGGIEDLRKIKQYCDFLIEQEINAIEEV